MSKKPTAPAKDTPKGDRIAKVLARAGVASRREAERMIEAGRVAVDGKVLTSPAFNVQGHQKITVDDAPIADAEPERLWLYHKPLGLVTTHKDEQGRKTIFDELPEDLPRVMTVGRLDLNSEGLLLLTNDGAVKRTLELPSTGWVRKYRVRVNGRPTEDTFAPLRRGIEVDGEKFAPMVISLDRQQGANAWVTVSLKEGKNREIRRAMGAIGLTVNRLIRVSYGPFQLGDLKPGAVEEVRRRVLRDHLGLEGAKPPESRRKPSRSRKGFGNGPGHTSGKPASGKPVSGKPAGKGFGQSEGQKTGKPFRKSGPGKPAAPAKGKPKGTFLGETTKRSAAKKGGAQNPRGQRKTR